MKRLILLILCFLPLNSLWAQDSASLIDQAREAHLQGDRISARELIPSLEQEIDGFNNSLAEEELKQLAQLQYYLGLLYLDQGNEEDAERIFTRGIEICSTGIERFGSDFFRAQDALMKSNWMLFQKTRIIIKTGSEIQETSELLLENNPDNLVARILYAQGRINAPALFGGDPREAFDLMQDSLKLASEPYELIGVYLTMTDAKRRIKKWDEAQVWLDKAMTLYPGNRNAQVIQQKIRDKEKS